MHSLNIAGNMGTCSLLYFSRKHLKAALIGYSKGRCKEGT